MRVIRKNPPRLGAQCSGGNREENGSLSDCTLSEWSIHRDSVPETSCVVIGLSHADTASCGGVYSRSAFDSSAEEYTKWYEHFSRHFDLYKNGEEMLCAGTPIRACLGFTKAEVAQAEKVNLFSIEDLAGCNEEALGYMGVGSRSLKIKAQEILKTQQTTRPAEEFAALHTQIEQLQADLKELREANKAANTKDRTLHIK